MKKVSEDTSKNTWTTSEPITDVDRQCKPSLGADDQRSERKWQATHFEPAGANLLRA
jgi:hypothetical protein